MVGVDLHNWADRGILYASKTGEILSSVAVQAAYPFAPFPPPNEGKGA